MTGMCNLQFYLPLPKTFNCEAIIGFTMPKPLSATFPIHSFVIYLHLRQVMEKDSSQFYSLTHRRCPATIISLSNHQIIFLLNMTDTIKCWGLWVSSQGSQGMLTCAYML